MMNPVVESFYLLIVTAITMMIASLILFGTIFIKLTLLCSLCVFFCAFVAYKVLRKNQLRENQS